MTRVEVPRQPRLWAPDIEEEYISQFNTRVPEPGECLACHLVPSRSHVDDLEVETDDETLVADDTELEAGSEDRVPPRKAQRGHNKGVYLAEKASRWLIISLLIRPLSKSAVKTSSQATE